MTEFTAWRHRAVGLFFIALTTPNLLIAQDGNDTQMTFALAGDAIISQRLSPFDEPEFLSMIDIVQDADLAFVNLEVLFHTYTEGYPAAHSGGTWMAAHPRLARELTWAGFDMVSLANNHTMEIIEHLAELSQLYGVEIAYDVERNVGVIR